MKPSSLKLKKSNAEKTKVHEYIDSWNGFLDDEACLPARQDSPNTFENYGYCEACLQQAGNKNHKS